MKKYYITIETIYCIYYKKMKDKSEAYFMLLSYNTTEDCMKKTQKIYISYEISKKKRSHELEDDDLVETRSNFLEILKG